MSSRQLQNVNKMEKFYQRFLSKFLEVAVENFQLPRMCATLLTEVSSFGARPRESGHRTKVHSIFVMPSLSRALRKFQRVHILEEALNQ